MGVLRSCLRPRGGALARTLLGAWLLLCPLAAGAQGGAPWIEGVEHVRLGEGFALLEQDESRYLHLLSPTVWEAVGNLIDYRGRLYAVGSTPYTNHNSADVYRYDPRRHRLRYEAHLFSQDAGQPTIHGGLLYYPAEDPRFSAGVGEFYVSNGDEWKWFQAPDAPAFHFHAMEPHGGKLYAAAAAWNALLYASEDRGGTWSQVYSHPTPEGRVTRINSLIRFQERLYAGGYAGRQAEHFLFRLGGGTLTPVTEVPPSRWCIPLAVHGGWLYLYLIGGERQGLYRYDGRRAERLAEFPGSTVRAGLSGGQALLLAGRVGREGALWRSTGGGAFRRVQMIPGGEPIALARSGGRVFVGVRRQKGRGELWVSANAATEGTIRTRALDDLRFLERLSISAPPGTEVRIQVARGSGEFTGADGTAATSYGWDERAGIALPAPYRLKLILRGSGPLTPYVEWGGPLPPPPPLPARHRPRIAPEELTARLQDLEALNEIDDFWGIRPLVREVRALAPSAQPRVGRWIAERLAHPYPTRPVALFGGDSAIRADWFFRHYLLMGLALHGRGRVAPEWWEGPFAIEPNGPEKHFTPHEAAVFAAAVLSQDDPATVASLIALLGKPGLPLWFKGDVVGSLTRLTGQRFAYDFAAW
ncbi:MAG: hypothetical protein V3T00_08000, partial [bacterium]